MNFSLAEIEKYCKDFSLKDSPLLSDLTESTWSSEELPQMLSGSLVGGLLQTIIRISGAVNILEIGMFTGYSALKMAEVLPENGKIHTCELMEKHINTASKWFKKSESGYKIIIHKGPALQSLERMKHLTFPRNRCCLQHGNVLSKTRISDQFTLRQFREDCCTLQNVLEIVIVTE